MTISRHNVPHQARQPDCPVSGRFLYERSVPRGRSCLCGLYQFSASSYSSGSFEDCQGRARGSPKCPPSIGTFILTLLNQTEIRQISKESAPDVDDWIRNAKAIHDDIEKSRKLASSIVRQAEADEDRLEGLQQQDNYMEFLSKEVQYNTQLLSSLRAIQGANELLRKLELQAAEHNLVDALHTLAGTLYPALRLMEYYSPPCA